MCATSATARINATPRTRTRAAPQALAAMRNTALTIIRRSGRKTAEGFEYFAEHRQQALDAATGQ